MKNKLKLQDQFIVFLCLVVISICWLLVINPEYFHNSGAEGLKIGRVNVDGADVRQKSGSEYFWRDIENSNDLHYGDAVFAGDNSSAFVEFEDGNSLKLNENSLVKFENKKNSLSLDLTFGQVQVDSNLKFITIKVCGQEIAIESNKAKFEIDKGQQCGDVKFKVKSGSIKVENKVIEVNTQFKLPEVNSRASLETFIKSIERPRNIKGHIERLQSGDLGFVANWDVVSQANEYEIEISSDAEMKNDKKTYLVKVNSFSLPVELGKVYFRLRANESAEQPGEFSAINVAKLEENLEVPQIKVTNFSTSGLSKLALSLSWLPSSHADQYHIEISDTADFTNIQAQTVAGTEVKFLNLDQTSAYARIRAENEFSKSEYSKPILVSFKYEVQNISDKVLSKKCVVRNHGEVGPKEEFKVEWKPIPMANEYTVKVFDQSKSSQVSQLQTRGPASNVSIPGCGEYDIKVEAYDKIGRKISSEFNATKIVYKSTLALLKPIISEAGKDMNLFVQKGVGRFIWLKWLAEKRSDSFFRVEIATDANFTENYKQFSVKDNKLLLKSEFQSGQYFWRVREHNSDLFSEWSDLGKVKVTTNNTDPK